MNKDWSEKNKRMQSLTGKEMPDFAREAPLRRHLYIRTNHGGDVIWF